MSTPSTGGPAFPIPFPHKETGMTLRQWFAGQSITAAMMLEIESAKAGSPAKDAPVAIAFHAYELADAMIAEGNK